MGALTLDWVAVLGLQDPQGAKSLDQIQNKAVDRYLSPTCIKLKNIEPSEETAQTDLLMIYSEPK